MTKPIEFYFDFASPYSYLAHKQIRKIEKEESIKSQSQNTPAIFDVNKMESWYYYIIYISVFFDTNRFD